MEQNKFELLEEVEQDIVVDPNEIPQMKEYEKLLLAERNRKELEVATNLIKFGCFEQKQETTVDFTTLEKIPAKKKYKGLYDLYRNTATDELLFICPLVENNKGDAEENTDMKPYGYDVIYLESMSDDVYKKVCKAAKNNLTNLVSVLYTTAWVLYFIFIAFFLYQFTYILVTVSVQGLWTTLVTVTQNCDIYLGLTIIIGILLSIFNMKLKKYKEQ